jgi:predicted ATPase
VIKSIKLTNLLSYGPQSAMLELRPLNVLIGPNGSGKSNLIEAIGLLRAAPTNFSQPVKGIEGGGVAEWLWKGTTDNREAKLEVTLDYPKANLPLRHFIAFAEHGKRFEVRDESIEDSQAGPDDSDSHFYYRFQGGHPVLNVRQEHPETFVPRKLRREDIDPEQSILSQRKDPDQYPEMHWLSENYEKIRIYSEWSFGRSSAQRLPQSADGRVDFLSERCDNLGLVLNSLRRKPTAKRRILTALSKLFDGIEDFEISTEANTVQVYLQEGDHSIPSTQLSDGTMRYLCLLAILCHPTPPPLICIEEPELGLHPDVLPEVVKLLKEASERTQLIVTTHSEMLIDALTQSPEDIVVCEKIEVQTQLRRLQEADLQAWLKQFSLGPLWRDGVLGGNRW